VGKVGKLTIYSVGNLFSVTIPILDLRLLHRELAGLHGYVLLKGACEARVAHLLGRHPGNMICGHGWRVWEEADVCRFCVKKWDPEMPENPEDPEVREG
jgi:hypothetical protein